MKSLVPRNYSSGNGKFSISTDRTITIQPSIAVRDNDLRSRSSYVRFRCKPPLHPRFSLMRIHFGLAELHAGESRFVFTNVRRPVVVSSEPVRDELRTTSTCLPTVVGTFRVVHLLFRVFQRSFCVCQPVATRRARRSMIVARFCRETR